MTDEELEEMKEEFPNAWWNLNYEEYPDLDEEDIIQDVIKAIDSKDKLYFQYLSDYVMDLREWIKERESLMCEYGCVYTDSLIVYCLCEKNFEMAEYFKNEGYEITESHAVQQLLREECREGMQWLLDNDLLSWCYGLWSTWRELCAKWDAGKAKEEKVEETDENTEEEIDENYWYDRCEYWRGQWKTLNEENKRLKAILDENGISY